MHNGTDSFPNVCVGLAKLKSAPKTDDAKTQLEQTLASNASMQQQIAEFEQKGIVQISAEERQRVDRLLGSHRKLWSQRRRLVKTRGRAAFLLLTLFSLTLVV
jgi:ABC-type hemin transport system ATPase subunit